MTLRTQTVFTLLVMNAGLALPHELPAQDALAPGTCVRVTAPSVGLNSYSGTVGSFDRDSLTIDTMTIARSALTSVEVRHFRAVGTLAGAALGVATVQVVARAVSNDAARVYAISVPLSALTGAAVGASPRHSTLYGALGALAGAGLGAALFIAEGRGGDSDISGAGYFVLYTTVPAAVGLSVGAVIGAVTHLKHWRHIPVDRLRVGVAPIGHDGIAVGVQLLL